MYYAICLVICNMQTKGGKGGREGGEYIQYIPRFTYSTFCPVSVITMGEGGGWEKRGRGGLERWGARERATESIV
jgi:hypothetical protein